jgi:coproporphyrinogen III oxidase-like Fe-S oxidoreductase
MPTERGIYMRTQSQILKDLKKALDLNYDGLIAYKLGYKSSTTPNLWLRRNSVPNWNLRKLDEVLREIFTQNEKEKIA